MNILERNTTFLLSVFKPDETSVYTLKEQLKGIQNGKTIEGLDFRSKIAELRAASTKKQSDKIKVTLPVMVVDGVYSKKSKKGVQRYSFMIALDFDKIDNIHEFKKQITKDKHVAAAFISPSGNGLKVVVACEIGSLDIDKVSVFHLAFFHWAKSYYRQYAKIDEACKDNGRAIFYSYDPNIFINNDAELVSIEDVKKAQHQTKQVKKKQVVKTTNKHHFFDIASKLISQAVEGQKHSTLLRGANLAGGYIASEEIDEEYAYDFLVSCISARNIDSLDNAKKTIKDGIEHGKKYPLETKDLDNKLSQPELVQNWLHNNYQFRYNIVANKYEYRALGYSWMDMEDRIENKIWMDINKSGIDKKQIGKQSIMNVIYSYDVSVDYDPFTEYFTNLSEWDSVDYIKQLTDCITLKDESKREYFYSMFKKVLLRTIGCAVDFKVNRIALVLVSKKQEIGKSELIRFLNPFGNKYYSDESLHGQEKDVSIALTANIIYNLEELEELTPKELAQTKKTLSKSAINVRPPYGHHVVERVRRCTFWASTNRSEFLVDDQNTRWIPFEIEHIDWQKYVKEICVHDIWTQANALYKAGQDGSLTKEEKRMRDENNQEFEMATNEENLILKLFKPSKKGEYGASFYTNTDIREAIDTHTESKFRFNDKKIFGALNKLGFKKDRKRIDDKVQRGYYVIRRSEQMKVTSKEEQNDIPKNQQGIKNMKATGSDYVPF